MGNLDWQNEAQVTDELGTLMQRYYPLVRSMWRRHPIWGMEYLDWQQEAWVTLYDSWQKYDQQQTVTFGSYYKQALHNRWVNLLRRETAQKKWPRQNQVDYDDYLASELYYVPKDEVHEIEQQLCIQGAMARFKAMVTQEEYLVYQLRWAGYSMREIATKQAMTMPEVRRCFGRGRLKFKHCFQRELFER
ncbi:MAG: sigma-70 family RNA polymerase sigma factor [Limosilactobacillus sp.]|nr:sigma-70 family RNA polymerase sigma factor [Limosilactobacillus sp.]